MLSIKRRIGNLIIQFDEGILDYYHYFDIKKETFNRFIVSKTKYIEDVDLLQTRIDLGELSRSGFTETGELVFCSSVLTKNLDLHFMVEAIVINLKQKTFRICDFDTRYLIKSNLKLPVSIFSELKQQK